MSEQLAAAAAALGSPEALVERSARARAAAQGVTYEEILAAWAGGTAAPAGAAPAAAPPPAPADDEVADADEAEAPAAPVAAAPNAAAAAPAAPALVGTPPAPATVSAREAFDYEAVTTVATVGIKERTNSGVPRWLSGLFVLLPVAALIYFISFANGPNCGVGGQLAVDRQTGQAENCDGTEFTRGGGAGGVDVRAVIGAGQTAYAANCASCHGPDGGGGVGPQLSGGMVASTFSACADHEEWVTLGSSGFQSAGNTTYGDTAKAIGGGMPGFGSSLSPEDLAAVVVFERVNFGGLNADEALVDCGLVQAADGTTDGSSPAGDGTETTTETTAGA
jgi:mono/diheme cytochrome c family protein